MKLKLNPDRKADSILGFEEIEVLAWNVDQNGTCLVKLDGQFDTMIVSDLLNEMFTDDNSPAIYLLVD